MDSVPYTNFFSDQYLQEFEDFLGSVNFTERNPLNTELYFLWSMIRSTRPQLFIESGTFRGYSAHFICEALARNENDAEFISYGFNLENCIPYASKRLAKYRFAQVIEGDSRELIFRFTNESRATAFFIDGPKGKNMPPLFSTILKSFKNILFIAVHDCDEENGSGNRWYVLNYFNKQFDYLFCDSPFQDQFSFLDEALIGRPEMEYWKPFYRSGKPQHSYGTQTCFAIPKKNFSGFNQFILNIYRLTRFRAYPGLRSHIKRLAGGNT